MLVTCFGYTGYRNAKFGQIQVHERMAGILTEVDSYDWIAFLPMADGSGAFNRYFGRLGSCKLKIRDVMARKRDTPEYVRRMQQELFEVLAQAKNREELRRAKSMAQKVR